MNLSNLACCCRKLEAAGLVASFFSVRCMRSWRPFCWGWPGLIRSMTIPSRSHQTASLLRLNKAWAEAKGTPLSLRILAGRPRSLKSRSNTRNCIASQAKHIPTANPAVTYTYDQSNCLGQPSCFNIGRRTSMTDTAGSESWAYDKMGRPLTDHRTTNSVTKNTLYTYNLDGSPATLT